MKTKLGTKSKDKTNQENDKKKKTTIKRMNTIFNIKTKQNQMKIDETGKKNQNKERQKNKKQGS